MICFLSEIFGNYFKKINVRYKNDIFDITLILKSILKWSYLFQNSILILDIFNNKAMVLFLICRYLLIVLKHETYKM